MSPRRRKSHEGHVPRWLYKGRGTKRKAILEGPYECPRCGKKTLTIKVDRENKTVESKCSCGLSTDLEFRPMFQPVDYYGKLIDQIYKPK